ncbi:MAG: glycosyltransferase [Candidatus Saccharimonadales bacterium]
MKKNPLVSVIIPAYNAESYIKIAIDSIQDQTYKNLEIIVIDDKSTDNTLSIANQLAEKDERIKLIKNTTNIGIGGNRNKGIEKSNGDYICWQDADDISRPDRIQNQVDYLESHPEVGMVGGFITFFEDEHEGKTRRYAEDDQTLRYNIFKYNPVAQPACMVRRACYERVGLYDSSLRVSEDLDMIFRIGEKFKFGNIQEVVIKYRQTSGSLTSSNLKEMEKVTLMLRDKYRYSDSYHFSFFDVLYNTAQRWSLCMPNSLRMRIFQLIRGDS